MKQGDRQPDAAVKSAGLSKKIAEVIVCQGPPACKLQGENAVAHAIGGCVWCEHVSIYADGSETREGPSHA